MLFFANLWNALLEMLSKILPLERSTPKMPFCNVMQCITGGDCRMHCSAVRFCEKREGGSTLQEQGAEVQSQCWRCCSNSVCFSAMCDSVCCNDAFCSFLSTLLQSLEHLCTMCTFHIAQCAGHCKTSLHFSLKVNCCWNQRCRAVGLNAMLLHRRVTRRFKKRVNWDASKVSPVLQR